MIFPPAVNTIADGIGVRVPIAEAVEDMRGIVDDVVLVDDRSIIEAMRLLHREAGLLGEPSGASGIAPLIEQPRGTKEPMLPLLFAAQTLRASNLPNGVLDRELSGLGPEIRRS